MLVLNPSKCQFARRDSSFHQRRQTERGARRREIYLSPLPKSTHCKIPAPPLRALGIRTAVREELSRMNMDQDLLTVTRSFD